MLAADFMAAGNAWHFVYRPKVHDIDISDALLHKVRHRIVVNKLECVSISVEAFHDSKVYHRVDE
eukprot:scaffold144517_cov22-Prasinocladus_malaysianus.AAC.1